MRYLGIDYGAKRTGLAICDKGEKITSPLAVLENPSLFIEKILDTVKTEDVEAVVIGLPLNMDDTQGPQAKLALQFAEQLKKQIDIPIHFQDERLSTFAAKEKIAPAGFTNKRRKKRLDAIAAAEILQTFLEQKKQI